MKASLRCLNPFIIVVLLTVLALSSAVIPAAGTSATRSQHAHGTTIAVDFSQRPLIFEERQGRRDGDVRFLARGSGYALLLQSSEATLRFEGSPLPESEGGMADRDAVLSMVLHGANPHARLTGREQLPGKVNYLLGSDPALWRTGISTFSRVAYEEAYAGIDLIFYGNQQQLEYDFVVSAGADPGVISLEFQGSRRISIDASGDMVILIDGGEVRWQAPILYQQVSGEQREVAGGFVLLGAARVGFAVGEYDPAFPLVIDPTLVYSTYLGGADNEQGRDIAVDDQGNAYIAGITVSADFPVSDEPFLPRMSGNDAVLTKLDADGQSVIYSTYIGGNGDDEANGVAVDDEGNVYLGGVTRSADFPLIDEFSGSLGGAADAFVTVLNPSGDEVLYSTYYGGTVGFLEGVDTLADLGLDDENAVYLTGITTSDDLPTSEGAAQEQRFGFGEDVYVAKFDTSEAGANSMIYATYLGGNDLDRGVSIAVDSAGNAYITGRTDSTDFPTTSSAFQTEYQGGPGALGSLDAFVTRLSADGHEFLYSTYLGGIGPDLAYGIAVDAASERMAFVTGQTASSNFPLSAKPLDDILDGGSDGFVATLDTSLDGDDSLVYSTFLGGPGDDVGLGIVAGADFEVVVTGATTAEGFPVTEDAIQSEYGGGGLDAFVARMSVKRGKPGLLGGVSSADRLSYSTLLGGSGDDWGQDVTADSGGNVYITGFTDSGDLATGNGVFDETANGGQDAFVVRIDKLLPVVDSNT